MLFKRSAQDEKVRSLWLKKPKRLKFYINQSHLDALKKDADGLGMSLSVLLECLFIKYMEEMI